MYTVKKQAILMRKGVGDGLPNLNQKCKKPGLLNWNEMLAHWAENHR